jgi:hypothetical protein
MKRSILAAALLVTLLPGCREDTIFLVRVTDINSGAATLADVQTIDEGPPIVITIPNDVVSLRITNKPYSPSVLTAPETYWHDFLLTSYSVRWRYADGTSLSGFDFDGGLSELIPINQTVEMGILLVPASMKMQAPFNTAVGGGASFDLIATIEFRGHPVIDPGKTYRFSGSTSVTIAELADQ